MATFLPDAQGEEVVSGIRASEPLAAMQQYVPAAFDELCRILRQLERHYRDLCDVEFTVQDGRLQILQVRVGKRSAAAAARIAVEMASGAEPLISRDQAVRRLTREQLRQLQSICAVRDGAVAIASGVAASPGVANGVICLDPDRAAEIAEGGRSVILVRPTTSPEDVHGMVKSAGIVTATGGMVSHAALVARGWGIAAVCGVGDLVFEPHLKIGGHELCEGDSLTIDGGGGRDLSRRLRCDGERGAGGAHRRYGGGARSLALSSAAMTRRMSRWTTLLLRRRRTTRPPTPLPSCAPSLCSVLPTDERIAVSLATSTEAVRHIIDAAAVRLISTERRAACN